MALVKALIITGYGTNCERESAHAARQAGAEVADVAYFFDLVAGRVRLTDYNLLVLPGGFLDGDDLGAAQAAALRWRYANDASGHPLVEQLTAFLDAGGLVIGICNGFQLLVKLGLLPAVDGMRFERQVSLSNNDSARFEDRWVRLKVNPDSPCLFTRGLDELELPVRHGEGKLVYRDPEIAERIRRDNLVAMSYVHPETGEPTEAYPYNPNGSPLGAAGLCDPSGRVFGLMPHPEAFNHPTNHPGWTRGADWPLGLVIFENAVSALRQGS